MRDYLKFDAERLLKSVVTNDMPSVFIFKDNQGHILYVNDQFYHKHPEYKNCPETVIGKTDYDLFPDCIEHAAQSFEDEQNVIHSGQPIHIFETEGKNSQGYTKVAHTRKYPLYDEENHCLGVMVVMDDVTEDISLMREKIEKNYILMKLNQELTQENSIDTLSGLYNRRFMHAKLDALYQQYQKDNSQFSIMMLDLDDFKMINDNYGHKVGDDVIVQIGHILSEVQKQLAPAIIPCRYGGDEFLIILPYYEKAEVVKIAEKIKQTFDQRVMHIDQFCDRIHLSIGIATIHNEDICELLQRCDRYLYQAKQDGKCRICYESLIGF